MILHVEKQGGRVRNYTELYSNPPSVDCDNIKRRRTTQQDRCVCVCRSAGRVALSIRRRNLGLLHSTGVHGLAGGHFHVHRAGPRYQAHKSAQNLVATSAPASVGLKLVDIYNGFSRYWEPFRKILQRKYTMQPDRQLVKLTVFPRILLCLFIIVLKYAEL